MTPAHGINETGIVSDATNYKDAIEEVARLKDQISRLRNYVLELEHSTDQDPLLAIYNRRAFIRELSRAQSVLERYGLPCSIIYFCLDRFSDISGQYGLTISNEILRRAESAFVSNTRACDMVARLGQGEFGLLLFKSDEEMARSKANALNLHVRDIQINLPTEVVSISATWGIAQCQVSETAEAMLARAYDDMYVAQVEKRMRLDEDEPKQ